MSAWPVLVLALVVMRQQSAALRATVVGAAPRPAPARRRLRAAIAARVPGR